MCKFKYLEEKSMQNHIEEFDRMISDVRLQVGIYDDFRDTILYGTSDISIKDVKEELMIKEQHKLEFESNNGKCTNRLYVMRGCSQKRRSESKSKTRSSPESFNW
ncbi:hypothetical protein HN51_055811 [Arachis hypogaea]